MSLLDTFLRAPAPDVAVELSAHRIVAASLDARAGQTTLTAHAIEPLPAGALVPALTGANIVDRSAVQAALGRALERVSKPRRVGLVLPDAVGRVSVVRFEKVPARAQELEQLVRWQVRKTAPFPIEEAQVSFVPGASAADGHEFLVTLARRDVVQEYEGLCSTAGAHAGLVDLSSMCVADAVRSSAAPLGDWMLLAIAPDAATVVIGRGVHPIFFRSRAAEGDDLLGELVHQTAMFYEDRLNGRGFSQVWLTGTAGDAVDIGALRKAVQERLQHPVSAIDLGRSVTFGSGASSADALAPVLGLLLRDRSTAKAGVA